MVIFKVPGGKKLELKELDKTLNPTWKTIYPIHINMPMNTIQPMRVEIMDYDLLGNDLIGYKNINLQAAL